MNAVIVRSYDAPPQFGSFAEPVAESGEQRVKVKAAALYHLVRGIAKGTHYGSTGELPVVAGVDGVGLLGDGQRVYFASARSPYGTMAEYSLAKSPLCLPLPDALSDAVAAGLANPGMSSWVALTARAQLVAGESVMVLGATGCAGQLAVQIAKRLGARHVVAVGRNREALAQLKALGADAVIPLEGNNLAGKDAETEASRRTMVETYRAHLADYGIGVVLDYLWGSPAQCLLESIAQKGLHTSAPRLRYVQIGGIAGPTLALAASILRSSGLELLGSGFGSASNEQMAQAIKELFASAAKQDFNFALETAPLREATSRWNEPTGVKRLVFEV